MSLDLGSVDLSGTAPVDLAALPAIRADVEVVVPEPAEVAEGPLWHEGTIWWCDITAGRLHRLDEHGQAQTVVRASWYLSALRPAVGGGLVVAADDGVYRLGPDSTAPDSAAPDGAGLGGPGLGESLGSPGNLPGRFNDAAVAPDGSLWLGAISGEDREGMVLRATVDGDRFVFTEAVSGVRLPNGIGFSADGSEMLLIDSFRYAIYACVVAGGTVVSARPWVRFDPDSGVLPDGWCQDAESCWWLAIWGGRCVVRLSPDGEPLGRLDLPVQNPTCTAFGPVGGNQLWVTTEGQVAGDPALLRVRVEETGAPVAQAQVPG
ncbi:SMP-30/gluconolactonase/LRE family protein [Ruania zhangjianzhongii]|uniref:SMP-30/gluconolactonase/LRE family protein n=1 Tax=Ruania zhangjianzhongii TaxID=2603206 RepID=UPI0011CA2343|nr:SMP-30/gluconolactonase/LRE family protein [Ruania zhangjianzhongii]